MREKFKSLLTNHSDIISYLFFGVLTTIINYIVYLPCLNILKLSAVASNMIAWVISVLFAYLTNKPFVFKSNDWSLKAVIPELSKFVGTRISSGLMETVILYLAVDLMQWNGNIWKLFTNVLVVIVNYIGSKLIVFRNGK